MRIASIGKDGNPRVSSLESMLDAGGFPIQVVKVFASIMFAFRNMLSSVIMQQNDFASVVGYG